MSNINERLTRIEQTLDTQRSDVEIFSQMVDGRYDPTVSLDENLRRAGIPEWAIPLRRVPEPDVPQSMG